MNMKGLTEKLPGKNLIWLVSLAVILILVIVIVSGPDRPSRKNQTKEEIDLNLLGDADVEKEAWRANAERELETFRVQQREIEAQLGRLTREIEENKRPLSNPSSNQISPPQQATPPIPALNLNRPPEKPIPSIPPRSIRVFLPEGNPISMPGSGEEGRDAEEERPDHPIAYLPSGSFVPGILLSGLDAPAGVNASKEPHPVLIKLSDLAVLPNRFRFDIKECFVIGEGYGELSSERAYIRTTSLSCVRRDGKSIDLPLKGFVAGEDGKNGLRGRVVSKEGQIIAKALLAGFAEGLSGAFSLSRTTVSVSPLGSTQTVDPGQALEAGLLGAVSRSTDRISQYYIKMAERVFPVIEIDAGRRVDIVVLQGKALQPVEEKKR
ncbi:MAG: TraB/VirB10 family protein [Nitrospiria bacterium]